MGLRLVTNTVKEVLEECKETRSDDFLLIAEVYKRLRPNLEGVSLDYALRHHLSYSLPSFSSIVRSRRKLQVIYPELESEEKIRIIREQEEQFYREYAKE